MADNQNSFQAYENPAIQTLQYPIPIIVALQKIPALVESDAFCTRLNFSRRRYSQSREACRLLLECLVKQTCFSQKGLIIRIPPYGRGDSGITMPITVDTMIKLTGMSRKRVERIKRELQVMGYLEGNQQIWLRCKGGARLKVCPFAIRLTLKFWYAVDCLDFFPGCYERAGWL